MQFFSTLTGVAIASAAIAFVLAEQQVHIKLHVSPDKFHVTELGDQCAFNSCVDPTIYPCANSVCFRLNYTYGVCSDKEEEQNDPNDPKLLCPYPNPYNTKLGTLDEDSYDSYDSYASTDV